jgi:hypothetical protein
MDLGARKRVLSLRFKVVQNTGLKRCSTRKQQTSGGELLWIVISFQLKRTQQVVLLNLSVA